MSSGPTWSCCTPPPNEFVFELFFPAGDEVFEMMAASTAAFSLEITIESPRRGLRARNAKFDYPNAALESAIASALRHGCRKLDLFFMAGIPGQRVQDALTTVGYCDHLVTRLGADPRLRHRCLLRQLPRADRDWRPKPGLRASAGYATTADGTGAVMVQVRSS